MSSFSQIDTTRVTIKNPIARLVIKDLIKYDGCVVELQATQDKVFKLEEREFQKDKAINLLEDRDKNNKFIIDTQKKQLELSGELTNKLNKELRGQRTKTFLYKAGTVLGVVASSYLLIK